MPDDVSEFVGLLRRPTEAQVEFVPIGGLAMVVHGSSMLTRDLDVMYRRDGVQADRIASAPGDLNPRRRDFPDESPYVWDWASGLNTPMPMLATDAGDVDLLAEAPGVSDFDRLWSNATIVEFEGSSIRVASEADLLAMKLGVDRPKDVVHIAELRDWLRTDETREP